MEREACQNCLAHGKLRTATYRVFWAGGAIRLFCRWCAAARKRTKAYWKMEKIA